MWLEAAPAVLPYSPCVEFVGSNGVVFDRVVCFGDRVVCVSPAAVRSIGNTAQQSEKRKKSKMVPGLCAVGQFLCVYRTQ